MLTIQRSPHFLSLVSKVKNQADTERIKKQIGKIIENHEIGKPMRYTRKGTREVYIGSFRLSYAYSHETNTITFLDLYHKDQQ